VTPPLLDHSPHCLQADDDLSVQALFSQLTLQAVLLVILPWTSRFDNSVLMFIFPSTSHPRASCNDPETRLFGIMFEGIEGLPCEFIYTNTAGAHL